ncbi:DUF4493 domain-containing protein [Phocaeicola plebeius]|uniref:DUF4493 domain-containing protein n=1 Tax=Phocaeicola plebeius TaxID=310297 RepID=A0A3E4Z7U5_9BACT|nr:DUF4493 domain-containing protein [Phocaeicola plebeius]RGM89380.1 DUF4493 domain-containing protein [Phocaeicola plebeius]
MKKIFLICLTLFTSLLAFTACHSEAMESVSSAKGDLNLSSMKAEVDTNVDTVYVGSRAESTVDVSSFLVTIYDAQSQKVEQWNYNAMPEIVSLAVGTYSIVVTSAETPSNGFDTPYYKGTATCEIKENEVVDVPVITCKLANMLFSVEYDEEFQGKIGEDVTTTITVGENSLEIPYSETRSAYLIAPEGETTSMIVTLKGTIDGESIDYSERVESVKIGVHNIIKYKFASVSDGSAGDGTLGVSIVVDSSMIGSDEVVGTDPGKEPGIDDFPEEGGEDPGDGDENAPTIVGSNFNGNAFDITKDVLEVKKGASAQLQVTLSALNGIAHVYVTIDSKTLTEDILTGVNLAKSFDLAEPGALEEGLKGLGFPTGDAVVGQTNLLFDITDFTSLLGIYGAANHNFIIRLVDQNGLEVTETLKIKSVE